MLVDALLPVGAQHDHLRNRGAERKIEKAETRIDFTRPAAEVHNHIRGLAPFPGAWFEVDLQGRALRVKALRSTRAEGQGAPGTVLDDALTIACGCGAVRLLRVQREGGGVVDGAAFLRGAPVRQVL